MSFKIPYKHFKGWHHFYMGVLIEMLCFFLIWTRIPSIIIYILGILGIIIMIDDMYQHLRQRQESEYHSPLHRLYGWFYARCSFIQKLNKFFDKLFGK